MAAPLLRPTDDPLRAPIDRAVVVLDRTQTADGSWRGDYSGPLFLPGMLIGTLHVIGRPLQGADRDDAIRYLRHTQEPDGGWGLGIQTPPTLFTSVLSYVALRLLDVPADDAAVVRARRWIHTHGGPTRSASWGRFFLAILGLYHWDGVDPLPPETWLLPRSLPVYPGRMWCHARMVYLPMTWLRTHRVTGPIDARIHAIREELYPEGWDHVRWRAHVGRVADTDAFTPRSRAFSLVNAALGLWDRVAPRRLRQHALDQVLDRIRHEDTVTNWRCIGPVNKLYDLLVWHTAAPDGPEVRAHLEALPVYLWRDDQGLRMNGYDASALWDTAFAAQALATAETPAATGVAHRAHRYVDATQVREDVPDAEAYDRCPSAGAWPFSTREHGWPITDCTAEGLQVVIQLAGSVDAPLDDDRRRMAVDRLLGWQNPDGSWASYERTRGPAWLEVLNPSDVFRDIMVDHGHTECSGASVAALAAFRAVDPDWRAREVHQAIARGARFLRHQQRPDGGWRGGWGVCFTYGTWFGVRGLVAAGVPTRDPALRRAVAFLRDLRLPDGGWGEQVEACRTGEPAPTASSQAVQTAWALLALMEAGETGPLVREGLAVLLRLQREDGTFQQDHVTGVFNGTCSIHYDAYPQVFPLWALAEARRRGLTPGGESA